MLLPEQVKTLIEGVTPCEHVEVEGDGHHFFAATPAEWAAKQA